MKGGGGGLKDYHSLKSYDFWVLYILAYLILFNMATLWDK